jgi:hypothetical protein
LKKELEKLHKLKSKISIEMVNHLS